MSRGRRSWASDERSLGGDFWASYTDLMAGLLMVFILMVTLAESAVSNSDFVVSPRAVVDPRF